jgi:predicted transcriptional regulator
MRQAKQEDPTIGEVAEGLGITTQGVRRMLAEGRAKPGKPRLVRQTVTQVREVQTVAREDADRLRKERGVTNDPTD